MPKQRIWLSYDLGVDGDYEGLYYWLDLHNAKECGDSVATLEFKYEEDLIEELKESLSVSVKIREKDRFYVIYKDELNHQLKGKFIFGKRKVAPWKGYAGEIEEEDT